MMEGRAADRARSCRIYSVQYSTPTGNESPEWAVAGSELERFGKLPPNERKIGTIIYHPLAVDGAWLLTMHEPLKEGFMSRIDGKGEVAVGEKSRTDVSLAHSSAVLFLDDGRTVALLKGNRSAPGADELQSFLKQWFVPPRKNQHWSVDPVLREDQVERIMESSGLLELSLGIDVTDDLLSEADSQDAPPLSAIADRVKHQFAPHGSVELGVKLDINRYTPEQAHRLQKAAHDELTRQTRRPRRGSATLLGPDGERQVINVVRDHATIQIDIQGPDPNEASFEDLAASLVVSKSHIEEFVEALH